MALRYWLPCNGNITNLGLAGDVYPKRNIVYADGLARKSLTSSVYIPSDNASEIMLSTNFSVSMWIYVDAEPGSTASWNVFFGGGETKRLHSLFNYPTVNDLHWSYQNPDVSGFPCAGVITGALPSYTWTHVTLTYDGSIVRIYANGELKGTGSYACQWTDYTIDVPISHDRRDLRYNDIRIYDHCLSVKEIDMISRPLIFRQRLSRGENPTLYNTPEYKAYGLSDLSGFGHDLTLNGIVTWQTNSPLSYGSVAFDGRGYFSSSNVYLTTPSCTYSFWAKIAWSSMVSGKSYPVISFSGDLTEIKFIDGRIHVTIETADSYCDYSYGVESLSDGWHFFVITYEKGLVALKIDGGKTTSTQFSDASNVESGTGNIVIGMDTDGNVADGLSLYDMRIYAKKLSDDDIDDLYHAKIGIDNKGNLYAHGAEPSSTDIAFGANGIVKADMIESTNGFRAYKDHIECTNFQEI